MEKKTIHFCIISNVITNSDSVITQCYLKCLPGITLKRIYKDHQKLKHCRIEILKKKNWWRCHNICLQCGTFKLQFLRVFF